MKIRKIKRLLTLSLLILLMASAIFVISTPKTNTVKASYIEMPAQYLKTLYLCWKVGDVLAVLGSPQWLYYFCLHGCLNKGLDPQTDEFWECVEQCKLKYLQGIAGDSDCGC